MASKIQQIVVTNTTPDVGEMGLVVRNISGGGIATDVTIVGAERSDTGTPVGITVSTSAVLILAANVNAKNRGITNNGSTNIFLGSDSLVTISGATMGLKLIPDGSYTDSGLDAYVGDIYGIGDAVSASENVSAWERS